MMTACAIQLVCFDLGGVMVRVCMSWRDVLARIGITPDDDLAHLIEDHRRDPQVHDFETGRIDAPTFCRRAAQQLRLDPSDIERALDDWLLGPYPGFDAVLERLNTNGIATACLSNTNPHHWTMMTGNGANRLPLASMRWHFASHTIGLMKPDPRIYEHVEQTTGIDPGAILFFDDNAENIAAARRRQWCAEPIDPDGDTAAQISQCLQRYGLW